ncbi:MAG: hypothetical protein ACFFHD_05590 [Promethearchaeota archaeon]
MLILKYRSEGWDYDEIEEHFNYLNNHFKKIEDKLRKQKKSDEYIQNKFKEEFAKLISN